MKSQQATHLSRFAGVVNDVVGGQPELPKPDVQKKDREEAREIENVLFHRNGPAKRWSKNTQGCANVGIVKEPLGENEIEQTAQGDQNTQGPIESAPRDVQSLARQEPATD